MSPELAKVYYLLGKSYDKQMTTIDRDQTAADNAQGWFRVVLDRYPDSEYAPKARRPAWRYVRVDGTARPLRRSAFISSTTTCARARAA
jgi:hypothetical protein